MNSISVHEKIYALKKPALHICRIAYSVRNGLPPLENQDLQWTPLPKILNRKIINIHFQNQIFDAITRLQNEFS